ncbi:MAG: 3-isopropylmalate dehydrogenase [Clostridia bacterium]|jgi:3-isopropylmalate dehydrogenase|nr:3-isopropylmalate dehydrogenase [Clostridia bacterium]
MVKVAVLPGDGIGPEIIESSMLVVNKVKEVFEIDFSFQKGLFGGSAYDATGTPFPTDTKKLVEESDAVLLGAVGGPKWDNLERGLRPESALLELRKRLGLYCNLRPVKYYNALENKVVWKPGYLEGVDVVVFRELTGGAYFGTKGRTEQEAYDTISYSREEVYRLAERGFELAQKRKKILHSIDKANVLETSRLWREVVNEINQKYPEVKVEHLYVDNAALQLVINPRQFDVIVTENMFGDILSDQAASIAGSLGMLPSASLGGKVNLYEPAHGSAPDIAGQNKANPIATILSVALMLRFTCQHEEAAQAVEVAVDQVLAQGYATIDIAGPGKKVVGTKEMAELIANIIK